jgi:predicted dehydrogenase
MQRMTSETKRLLVAVVGCGRIAQDHLQAYQNIKQAELVAVADVVERQAQSVGEQFGCRPFTDYRRMLEEVRPDAVSVCTPPSSHAEITLDALARGVHVLCEKPFATTLPDAKEMLNAAADAGLVLMMASKFRFVDDVVKAKGIIDSGILGQIILFENVFCSRVDMRGRWNSRKEVAGGGVLFDNGSHSVDLARYLLGPITAVQAQHGLQVQPIEVEDTSRMYFQTAGGVMGSIDLSWSIHKEIESYVSVFGTEGTLSVGWRESKYRQSEKMGWVVFGTGYDKQRAFIRQQGHFLDCVAGRAIPLITATDGLESVRVIEAAYRSSDVNKWAELEPIDSIR